MQSRIRVLDELTINQIAAGEVIENPASVVKELVENAIDAESTEIYVEIQEGGRRCIRISDNGSGMSPDDALLCLERHATSKIREVHDIQEIYTMGFRGEAIPSIAAVSRFSVLTASKADSSKEANGTFLEVEGGKILSCKAAARTPGTTVEVKSLFFNVPVRRKFQKSPSFDTQEILKMLQLLALANPEIQFELIADQKTLFKTAPLNSEECFSDILIGRIASISGKETSSSLLPVKFLQDSYEAEGFIGKPDLHKPNRKGQYLFINRRAVYSSIISGAVREGYGTMIPENRFPFFVLHLRIPGSLIDVNVHPQKREVRLYQEFRLKESIIRGIEQAFRQEPLSDNVFSGSVLPEETLTPPPFWGSYSSFLSRSDDRSVPTFEPSRESPETNSDSVDRQTGPAYRDRSLFCLSSAKSNRHVPSEISPSHLSSPIPEATKLRSVPQVIATLVGYILTEPFSPPGRSGIATSTPEEGVTLVDQRAAYSRIYFEKLMSRAGNPEMQQLLIPLTLRLSFGETQAVQENLSALTGMGFSLRHFGDRTFLVDAFPGYMNADNLETCLSFIVRDLSEMHTSRYPDQKRAERLALVACKGSLPVTKRLSTEEAQILLRELMKCDISFQCPFGKPIFAYLSTQELANRFQK